MIGLLMLLASNKKLTFGVSKVRSGGSSRAFALLCLLPGVTRCCKREDAKSEKEQSSSEMVFCSEKPLNLLIEKIKIGIRAQPC